MSKKILAAVLAVLMVIGMVPMTAMAADTVGGHVYGDSGIAAAILHDTRVGSDSAAISDERLVKNYDVTNVADSSEAGVDKTVTISGTKLRAHKNDANPGLVTYWIGFSIAAPTGATHFKMAGNPDKDTAISAERWATKSVVRAVSTGINSNGDSGFLQYIDLGNEGFSVPGKIYIKIQWLKNEEEALEGSEPTVYEFNYQGVTKAQPIESLTVAVAADGALSVKKGDADYSGTDLKYYLADSTKATEIAKWDTATTSEEVQTALGQPVEIGEDGLTQISNGKFLVAVDFDAESCVIAAGESAAIHVKSNQAYVKTVLEQLISAGTEAGTKDAPKTAKIEVPYSNAAVKPSDIKVATDANLKLYSNSSFTTEADSESGIALAPDADTTVYIEVTAENMVNKMYYAVTIARAAASKNAKISAVTVGGYDVEPPADGGASATEAAVIEAEVPKNVDLTSAEVKLTVDPTATVKTVSASTAPDEEAGYTDSQTTGEDGCVTISTVNFTNPLYVLVTAQDGTTKRFYKITAEALKIVIGDTGEAEPSYGDLEGEDKTKAETAVGNTDITPSPEMGQKVLDVVQANEATINATTATAALEAESIDVSSGVFIHAIPYLEISVETYDTENEAYTVDITPHVKFIAATTENTEDLDESNSVEFGSRKVVEDIGTTSVTIGIPETIATDDDKVYVAHEGGKTYFETVASNAVTVTVDHFSKFDISKATDVYLTDLSISGASIAFNKETTAYTANVANNVTSVTVTPTAPENLKVTVNGATFTGEPIEITNLGVGDNAVTVIVTDEGNLIKTYTVTIKRAEPSTPSVDGGGGSSSSQGSVSVTNPTNGAISVSPSSAKKGETVTVTVTPKEKYLVVTGVTVRDSKGGSVTATKNANGTYSFQMPEGNVTVSATISHIFDLFKDVPAGSFYAEPVKWAVEKGIALGTDPVNYSSFGTAASCTRKEMVLFLYRAAGSPKVTGTNAFTDIQGSAYDAYRDAIQWAVDNGITQGTSATTFAPNANCSRSEMVTFLHRYDKTPAVTGSNKFVDVPANAFYKDAVQWAVNKNITAGTNAEGTTFTPDRACTRGEMAIFLFRFLGK